MSNPSTCPDITLLSRVLDHEASPPEADATTQHLATCAKCSTLMAHLQHVTDKRHFLLAQSPVPSSIAFRTPTCLSPEAVAAYVQRLLPQKDKDSTEQHLQTCNACFNEVQSAFRIASVLSTPEKGLVPAALKTQAATSWQQSQAGEQRTSLSRVVIQLAEKSLKLLEQNLVAPFFDIQKVFVPAPSYRSEDAPTRLDLKFIAGQHTIALTVLPDGKGIALTLTLLGSQQESLAGQRVFFNQQGKSILSKKTDQQGVLRVPHLAPGIYEIVCAGIAASFEVDLHT
jgi:hypothetical protein